MTKNITISLLPLLITLALAFKVDILLAQRVNGEVGIGAQVGQPTGVTLKIFRERASLDFLAAYNWDDFFFLNVHSIYDVHLNDRNTSHFFYGPGGFIGVRDRRGNDQVELGVSASFGLDFIFDKIEIFVQATPRLALSPGTEFDMGGGAGLRIYF